uniref:Putative asparaginase n=1 Tax=Leptospirillum ferrodiazotrophum TaxID=412449 RepID=C6I125_9BACT|nr:MAG: putative asparaginase [Leptospirillum ferrodiazotrophum]
MGGCVNSSAGPLLLFHCGTGSELTPESRQFFGGLLPEIAGKLRSREKAFDLAVWCVNRLEESGLFNAGRGAIPQADGVVRRDAGAMDGATLKALGISQVRGVPSMSRLVAALHGKSPHVHLAGTMAERWAISNGWPDAGSQEAGLPDPLSFWNESGQTGSGTVGCVVRDGAGHLASVTSTGGIGRMWPGRIGDSPIVGGGFYADDELGAISMTGVGEAILTSGGGVAMLVSISLAREGSPSESARQWLERLEKRFGATAGCVGISRERPFFAHTSPVMIRGYVGMDRVLVEDCADRDPF